MFNSLLSTKTGVKIGYLPLLDCAPLVIAQEAGFFAEQGLTVQLSRENNWASIRDKLSLGMIDAAHLLAPMVIASHMRLPNNDPKKAFTTSLALGYNGNAITISNHLATELGGDLNDLSTTLQRLREFIEASERKIIIGSVYPHAMHTYLIHLLLNRAGIARDQVEIKVIPPVRMVDAIKDCDVDLFCVGEPWNTAAQLEKAGQILCYTSELWPYAPEKVLGVNAQFAVEKAETHKNIIKALINASQWLEEPDHMAQAAIWLSSEDYLNCSSDLLIQAMVSQWKTQNQTMQDRKIFFSHHATAPWAAHAQWIAHTMTELNTLSEETLATDINLSHAYDWSIYAQALSELNLTIPTEVDCPGKIPSFK